VEPPCYCYPTTTYHRNWHTIINAWPQTTHHVGFLLVAVVAEVVVRESQANGYYKALWISSDEAWLVGKSSRSATWTCGGLEAA